MRRARGKRTLAVGVGAAAVLCGAPGVAAAAPTPADVQHDVVLVQYFDGADDPCGLGPVEETMVDAVQVRRVAAGDGSFHLVDVETGRVYVDAGADGTTDAVFRRTETFTLHATPGGVFIVNQVFRQSDGELTFVDRFHVTEVKGVVKADHGSQSFPDCP